MAQQITLNAKSLDKLVAELDEIKGKVSAHAGTQSARINAARAAVLPGLVIDTAAVVKIGDSFDDVDAILESIKARMSQIMDEAVTAKMAEDKTATGADLSALRDLFKTKREAALAMQTLLVSIGIDDAATVAIPTLKGTGAVGTGGTSKVSGQQFYRVVEGTRRDQPTSQNKFSSLAYYFGAAIMGQENRPSTGELEAFLVSKGVTPKGGTAWSYQVSDDFTVGMDVNEAAEAADEEAPAETK